MALRAAEKNYTEFSVPLTHHGEQTGVLTGGIQLRTSEGKLTEKLYGKYILNNVCSFNFCNSVLIVIIPKSRNKYYFYLPDSLDVFSEKYSM